MKEMNPVAQIETSRYSSQLLFCWLQAFFFAASWQHPQIKTSEHLHVLYMLDKRSGRGDVAAENWGALQKTPQQVKRTMSTDLLRFAGSECRTCKKEQGSV